MYLLTHILLVYYTPLVSIHLENIFVNIFNSLEKSHFYDKLVYFPSYCVIRGAFKICKL